MRALSLFVATLQLPVVLPVGRQGEVQMQGLQRKKICLMGNPQVVWKSRQRRGGKVEDIV